MLGSIKRRYLREWESGHYFRAVAGFFFIAFWIPLYLRGAVFGSGGWERFVSTFVGVTVQWLMMAGFFTLVARFPAGKYGERK